MPYIKQERRVALCENTSRPQNAGELNYCITMMLVEYWMAHGPKYQIINDIVGACEGAKLEFQRRVTGKYEDQKITENGDVYP